MKQKRMNKVFSFLIMVTMLFQMTAGPLEILVQTIVAEAASALSGGSSGTGGTSYTSLDDVTIPTVTENPYDVSINVEAYPIYSDEVFEWLFNDGVVTGIGRALDQSNEHSPYYTASISPKFEYRAYNHDRTEDHMVLQSNLPYRDTNPLVLQPDLVLSDGGMLIEALLSDYDFLNLPYAIKDQTTLRLGAKVLSGSGTIQSDLPDQLGYRTDGKVTDEAVQLQLNVPLSTYNPYYSKPRFTANGGDMTDIYMALIDNTSPSASYMNTSLDETTGELTLRVGFNELLRWSNQAAVYDLNNIWMEVELKNLNTGKKSRLRMYIAELNGKELVFRGQLGDYKYANFRLERVTNVGMSSTNREFTIAAMDTATGIYTSPFDSVSYGNQIYAPIEGLIYTTSITDHAGNPLNLLSSVNWIFRKDSFYANSFEAKEVKIYNEITVNTMKEVQEAPTDWPEDIDRTHLFAGPGNTLTAQIFTAAQLSKEECKKVTAVLNILDADGKPLEVPCTSSYTYVTEEEVYGCSSGTPLTVLLFEDIELEEGMSIDVAEGETPQIKVVTWKDTIDDKTAYPYIVEPSRQLYGDFTKPTAKVRLLQTTEPSDSKTYHTLVAELNLAEDVSNSPYYAGVMTTDAEFFIGGTVEEPVNIRYIISDSPTGPADASGYTEKEVIPVNGERSLGTKPVTSESVTWYLHIMTESGSLLVDDIFVRIEGEDLVGNTVDTKVDLEWQIDEVAPAASFLGKRVTFAENNTAADVSVTIKAQDYNQVVSVQYRWGSDSEMVDPDQAPPEEGTTTENNQTIPWTTVEITPGQTATATIQRMFGGLDGDNTIYTVKLWVKTTDLAGNVSEPIGFDVVISTEKPDTYVTVESDLNKPDTHPVITVEGPPVSNDSDELTAYTRVTVAPADGSAAWEYVTVVPTGSTLDIFSFAGKWYKVTRSQDRFETVVELPTVDESFVLSTESPWYDLFTYYGELKTSFENGYRETVMTDSGEVIKDMTPIAGQYVYENVKGASYLDDPNYYVVRYASRNSETLNVHKIDFGTVVDRENNVLSGNADQGNSGILFNATKKNVNPMRSTRITFSLSNLIRSDWGLMDVDFASSYMELHQVVGETDQVVASRQGLAGIETQYFSIPNRTDSGEEFVTGKYYLRVCVVSYSGSVTVSESISMLLDAETVKNDGLWSYELVPYASAILGSQIYTAETEPFRSMGVSIAMSGEVMRSNTFAVYSGGLSGFSLRLEADQNVVTYDGVELGAVEGFRYWNILSDPTDEELASQRFFLSNGNHVSNDTAFLQISGNTNKIYTPDTIPKGLRGFNDGGRNLYLVKGVNTICYQVKMANGYISPVRQITVIVSDYLPEFNVAIDDYVPSHVAAQMDGMVNAHSITYFVEYAYSLNGSGAVDVRVYGTYEMEVNGKKTTDPAPLFNRLDLMAQGLKDEDTIVLKQNSYTSKFDSTDRDTFCTAAFVAIDEYGGVTVVAPQIGDELRYGNSAATTADRYNMDYDDGYQTDPYTGDWVHTLYNEPVYYGAQVLRFENYRSIDNGETEVVMTSIPQLMYNLFNISTNDVEWGGATTGGKYHNDETNGVIYPLYSSISYFGGNNFDLINWDAAQITFSGGDLGEEKITLPLNFRGVNNAGFMGAFYSKGGTSFSFEVASMPRSGTALESFDVVFTDAVEATDETEAQPATVSFMLPGTTERIVLNYRTRDDMGTMFYEKDAIVYVDDDGVATSLRYGGASYSLVKSDNSGKVLAGTYSGKIKTISRSYSIEGYTVYGDYFGISGSIEVDYTDDYTVILESVQEYVYEKTDEYYGVILYFSMYSVEEGNSIKTGRMNGGDYEITLTDYYGKKHTFKHTIETIIDEGTDVTFSTLEPTANPVEIILKREDGKKITVDIVDYGLMTVTEMEDESGNPFLKVTVNENTVFSYRYMNGNEEKTIKINIKNIVKPSPKLVWDYDLNDVLSDDNGYYRYGTVTVTLVDDNFDLTDLYNGKIPSFTFHPGGETSYTFEADSILATVGEDSVKLPKDIWVELPFELREVPDPLGIYDPITGERLADTDTPNVQVLAYSNQNGYYAEEHLALRVTSGRNSNSLTDHEGYALFEYVGDRGEASDLLAQMGWATVYRFEVEISDMSRTRLFVKEGLYGSAPDYDTGYSDNINGVKLYSRLLSVSAPAAFTLFVVDKENNSTAVAFNITNVGEAPFATTVKIPQADGETVRVYVLPPEEDGVTDFEVYSLDSGVSVLKDEDTASDFYGMYYVAYSDNDDYIINYRFKYNGTLVENTVNTSIIEINHREIALAGNGITWSDNAAFESTDQAVSVMIRLTEAVTDLQVIGTYDESIVSYEIAGNTVRVTYTENHGAITLICIADNGTSVTVPLAAVTNIDRAAPEITVVKKELATNGKSLVLTLTSNERAIFREGGYVGELGDDNLYYYTRTITENGTYTYHFIDMAGTVTEFEVEIKELVKDALEIQYSTSSDGAEAVTDPAELEVMVGDLVYVNPSRNVTAQMSGGEEMELTAGTWTPITISEAMGGILPYLVAEDAYRNVLTHQFSKVQIPDGTPPVLVVERFIFAVKVDSDREDVKAALLANFTAFDEDTELTYNVEFTENMSLTGVFDVIYTATDSSGNVGREIGKLRINAGSEPVVKVDGEDVYRDATHILKTDADGNLVVDVEGRSYSVSIKSGIKTVAQMKIGSTTLAANVTGTEPINLGELEQGYYTLCILTQDRDYFRMILYVE